MLPPRALFLGSYPPRECGIATFTKDMVDAYDRAFGISSPVIAIDEPGAEVRRYPPEVVAPHRGRGARTATLRPPTSSTHYPVELVNIQHEYGLFGGERGEWLVDFIRAARKAGRADAAHRPARARRKLSARDARALRARARVVALSETGRGSARNHRTASTRARSE